MGGGVNNEFVNKFKRYEPEPGNGLLKGEFRYLDGYRTLRSFITRSSGEKPSKSRADVLAPFCRNYILIVFTSTVQNRIFIVVSEHFDLHHFSVNSEKKAWP